MSLISKIQALITAANAKTGETDATLTDAVQTLVDGYGGGGADPVINPLTVTENGTYTASSGVDGYNPVVVNVGGGTEIIVTSDAADTERAAKVLFPNYPNGFDEKTYYIALWKADFTDNPTAYRVGYFIFMTDENGVPEGTYVSRYDGGHWKGTNSIDSRYYGTLSVGDKFLIYKYTYEG